MAETTDVVLGYLQNKTPQQIERTLKNLEAMSLTQAQESGSIAAKQAASDAEMSLAEVQVKLEKANAAGDLEALKRWQPLHREKLDWVLSQMAANEQARVAEINAPAVEARQAKYQEHISEMDALNRKIGRSDADMKRLGELQKEIRELA
jgi:hypothetical protein